MRKIIVFSLFLFAVVVCFAAPPPDLPAVPFLTENVEQVCDQVCLPVLTVEPQQEVAFVYIGNHFGTDVALCLPEELPDVSMTKGVITNGCCFAIDKYQFRLNMQNSNYSYPFGANYQQV